MGVCEHSGTFHIENLNNYNLRGFPKTGFIDCQLASPGPSYPTKLLGNRFYLFLVVFVWLCIPNFSINDQKCAHCNTSGSTNNPVAWADAAMPKTLFDILYQYQPHKYTIGICHVVSKRIAIFKTKSTVESSSWLKERH